MTDEELIEELRSVDQADATDCSLSSPYFIKAADRIEELVKEAAETHKKKTMSRIKKWGAALKGQREAEAKLAKAVAALRAIKDEAQYDTAWSIACGVLEIMEDTE